MPRGTVAAVAACALLANEYRMGATGTARDAPGYRAAPSQGGRGRARAYSAQARKGCPKASPRCALQLVQQLLGFDLDGLFRVLRKELREEVLRVFAVAFLHENAR